MASSHRQFKLAIWGLALGYFVFYAPYVALIKIVVNGRWPGVSDPVTGFRLLPAVVISTAVVLFAIVSLKGWWKYAGRRRLFGRSIPFPRALVFLSGVGTAVIVATTTLIFSFKGISIVLALVLMRGGVLIMGPVVDRVFQRRVRWFSWAALTITALAVMIALADGSNYRLSNLTTTIIIAYLAGYVLRIPCATRLAKSRDASITYRYFVEEQLVAILVLLMLPAVLALIGKGEIMLELRAGFAELFTSSVTLPALIIGGLYACLYCFGTLIYLDCRENTYCIPLNRSSSLLAGCLASLLLTISLGFDPPAAPQLLGAALLVVALLLLSPFHHTLQHALEKVKQLLDRTHGGAEIITRVNDMAVDASAISAVAAKPASLRNHAKDTAAKKSTPRIFLFVCSGNTCRSPMAAAVTNAEIAARLGIPYESLETVNVRALSAGVSARVGAPLTAEAQQVLRSLSVPVGPHAARNLTPELAEQAEMIFCMTSAHRRAVIEMVPAVAGKTVCLDPTGDIDDPIGKGLAAYLSCIERIRRLVQLRFEELDLVSDLRG